MTDKKTELRKQAEEKASHLPKNVDVMSPAETRQTLHELRVHQIELEVQNDELRRARAELDAAGAGYFDFYDLAPVGYFTLNEEGLILEANLTAAALLDVARDDLIRQPFPRYILKEDADSFYLHRKQLFENAAPQMWEMRMLKKDRTIFWVQVEAIAAQDADGAPTCRMVISDITERKQQDVALRESEERFHNFFMNAPVGINGFDSEGKVIAVNSVARRYFGVSEDDPLSGYRLFEDPSISEETKAKIRDGQIATEERFIDFQAIKKHKMYDTIKNEDDRVYIHFTYTPYGPINNPAGYIVIIQDITERNEAEKALQLSNERLEEAQKIAWIGNWEADLSTDELYWSQVIFDIFGFDSKSFKPSVKAFHAAVHPDDKDIVLESEKRSEQTGLHDVVHRIIRPDGEVRFVHELAKRYTDDNGKLVQLRGTVQDITARKRFEEVQAFLAQTSSGTLGDPFFEALARYLARNLGMDYVCIDRLEGDELTARTVAVWCDGHFEDNVTYALKDTPCGDVVGQAVCCFPAGVCQLFPRDPALQDLKAESYVGVTLFDHTGRPIGLIAVIGRKPLANRPQAEAILKMVAVRASGEMERLDAEEALRESEEKYRNIFQNAAIGIFQSLPEGRFLRVNPALAQMMGYVSPEEMISAITDISAQIYVDPKKRADIIAATMEDTGWVLAENRYRRKDGTIMIADLTLRKVLHPDGTVAYFEGFVTDITAHKHLEEELLRARKLESLGVLAGGIAHDFNNLLGVVQGYMDLVLSDLPPGHVSRQLLLTAMRSVSQTKDLTSRLITFSRGGGPIKEIFDVAAIIREAVQRTVKGTKVRVNFDFREELWPAEVDDLQMKQVFNNLTRNAVEATPEGGILTIQAENALLPAGGVLDLQEGAYLKITFTDEGSGIHEEHLAKIFDPYFSTKRMAAQNGLGLGLAVCYSVLKSHDGHITVQSLPGKGASFVLYIPARPELAKGKEVKQTTSTDSRVGPVRALIMDDDPQARGLMRAYLERMDYEVTDVQDGQEAIDAYRKALESETPFDLALLELKVRQGMGGEVTMKRLLKIAPAIKAIIVSEYVDDPVMLKYADYGFQGALRKPLKREEMKHLVEKVLHD